MSNFDDFAMEATDKQLKSVAEQAEQAEKVADYIERLEAEMEAAKTEYNRLTREVLPRLMGEAGLTEFRLTSGAKVETKLAIDSKMPKDEESRQAIYSKLAPFGVDEIVKTTVSVSLPKDSAEKLEKALEALNAAGFNPAIERGAHHSTMKAWLREQMEKGAAIPMEELGFWYGTVTSVKK